MVGQADRLGVYSSVESRHSYFVSLSNEDKFKFLVCPSNAVNCKIVSSFLQKQFDQHDKIDRGEISTP